MLPSSLLASARRFRQASRPAEAEATYLRIFDEEPESGAQACHELGLMALDAGQSSAAADWIAGAIELDGTSAEFFADYCRALEADNRVAEAIAAAERSIALGNTSIALISRLFSLYFKEGRPSDAVKLVDLLTSDQGIAGDAEKRGVRGSIRRMIGDHVGAATDLRSALAWFPTHSSGWQLLGRIERAAGNETRAITCYGRAAAFEGDNPDLVRDRGIALQRLGLIEQARSCFRAITDSRPYAMCRGADLDLPALADLDISPERAGSVWQRGIEAEKDGRRLEAIALLAVASSLAPRDNRAREDLNRVLALIGKRSVQFYFLYHSSMNLATEPDMYLRRVQLGQNPDDLQIVFLSGTRATNRTLLTMWTRHLPLVVDDRLYYSMMETLLPEFLAPRTLITSDAYENYAHPSSRAELRFTPEEIERGRIGLRRLGIDPDVDWFACVFARDNGWVAKTFTGLTHMYTDFRNADINTYHAAIHLIVERGGKVVRIGAFPRQALDIVHPAVVDYATVAREDFMDIFLVAHARFLMGTPAGIHDAGRLFHTPTLHVNSVPVGFCPPGKRMLYLPKLPVRAASGDPVPIDEYLAHYRSPDPVPAIFTDRGLKRYGYAYVDNTPEELREAAEEMLELLDGKWGTNPADQALLARYFSLFEAYPLTNSPARVRQPVVLAHLRRYRNWYFPEG